MGKAVNSSGPAARLMAVIWVCMLSTCGGLSRKEVPAEELSSLPVIKQALYYASLAGSSHNVQPWRVAVYGKDSIQIHLDKGRVLPVVDPDFREVYMSIGAFLENFMQAASCLGYRTTLTVHNDQKGHIKALASVKMRRREYGINAAGLEAIRLRRTLRTAFDTVPIHASHLQLLTEAAQGRLAYFPITSSEGKYISENNLAAYKQQVRNKQAQAELAKWVRFSGREAALHMDGLTPAGMDITGIKGWIVSHLLNAEDINSASAIRQGIQRTEMQVKKCAGWLVIFGKDQANQREEWIRAGRIYERLNIKCRSLKIGFQPVSQILEEEPFAARLTKKLHCGRGPLMVIRVGYVTEYPAPVSLRRPVDRFTLFK